MTALYETINGIGWLFPQCRAFVVLLYRSNSSSSRQPLLGWAKYLKLFGQKVPKPKERKLHGSNSWLNWFSAGPGPPGWASTGRNNVCVEQSHAPTIDGEDIWRNEREDGSELLFRKPAGFQALVMARSYLKNYIYLQSWPSIGSNIAWKKIHSHQLYYTY
jgi:hypothetical protein